MNENDKLLEDFLKLKPIRVSNDGSLFTFSWKNWIVFIGCYFDTDKYFMRIGFNIENRKDFIISEDSFWKVRDYFFQEQDVEKFKNDIIKSIRKLKLDNLNEI
jgi:hypothetical protein